MCVEHIDDLRKVSERPSQPVDLIDNDDLNLGGLNVGQQPLKRRSLHGATRKPSVVVEIGKARPPGVLLA